MYTTPTNVINSTPDFLVGVESGNPVLVPRGIALSGPTGQEDLTGAERVAVKSLVSDAGNWLAKPSKNAYDLTDTTRTYGYTAATAVLDKAFQRYSNYTRRLDLSASTAQIRMPTAAITADPVDQMLSLWIYLPFMPVPGAGGQSINVVVCNSNAFDSVNKITFGFDSLYLRQGWNELRMWAGDTDGVSGAGTLAYGAVKTSTGTGCDFTANIGYMEVSFTNMSGRSVYLCSVRRSAKASPVLVMGFDATGINADDPVFTTKVGPLFREFGVKGYFTVTNVYDLLYSGSADDLRKRSLYADFGWDAINHTWNHGATVPGGTWTVTGSAASDVVTLTRTAHGYPVGSRLHAAISGATPSAANGVWEMTAATVNTLTYTAAGAGTVALTGTITMSTLLADVIAATGTVQSQILRHEIVDIATAMRGAGFVRGSNVGAFPNNSCPELSVLAESCTAAGVRLFRGIRGGTVKLSEFGVDNPLHFGSFEMGSGATATTLEYLKAKLTGAIGRGEHMWTYGHYILDDTDPANAAYFPVDNNLAPGQGSNPAPPAAGAQGGGGGWWYLSTLRRFLNEAVVPSGVTVLRPTDWGKRIGAL